MAGNVWVSNENSNRTGTGILNGRSILVAGSSNCAGQLTSGLRKLGAQVVELPAAVIRPNEGAEELEKVLQGFGSHSDEAWLVFTSPAGVRIFFEKLAQLSINVRSLRKRRAKVRFAAIGPVTKQELLYHGVLPDVMPHRYRAADLGKKLAAAAKAGSQVLIVRGQYGAAELLPPLMAARLWGEDMAVFEAVNDIGELQSGMREACLEEEIGTIVFTSAAAVRKFVETMKDFDYSKVPAVCINRRTFAAVKKTPIRTIVTAAESPESLIETIVGLSGKL